MVTQNRRIFMTVYSRREESKIWQFKVELCMRTMYLILPSVAQFEILQPHPILWLWGVGIFVNSFLDIIHIVY